MSRAIRHVLVTGRPGIGKTTLICDVARRLSRLRPAGFYTQEIRGESTRTGFRVVLLPASRASGRMRDLILSHVEYGPPRVGRYGVNVAGFERLLRNLDLSHSAGPFVVIDEIGKMECLSPLFVQEMTALLDSSRRVLATIALKGDGFIRTVKARQDIELLTVNIQNRDELVQRITKILRRGIGDAEER
jgi:nucleoside-triphosphatase